MTETKDKENKGEISGSKVLITGGLGLIGSTIASKLVAKGAHVTILDAELPRYGGNWFNIKDIEDSIEYIKGDIRDSATVSYAVTGKDIIFNLAGQVDYNYSLKDPLVDLGLNCEGHLVVLENCRRFNPGVKILFTGSRMQYGKTISNPVSEDHPTNPLSLYGIHKLTAEKYYTTYHDHYGIKSVSFRITNPYGPRSQMKHSFYSIVNWFIRQAMEGKDITVFGDGKQVRDYIFVDDLADAMIAAAYSSNTDGEIYNLGSGNPTMFIDMVNTIIDTVGSGQLVQKEWPKEWENVETGGFYANIDKLKKAIDWEPKISIKEGIKQTVDYYKKHRKHYWN